MTMRIPLANGTVVLLDEEDAARVLGKLLGQSSHGYIRAGRWYLHRLVMSAKSGDLIDHANGDRADCPRANLRFASDNENAQNRGAASHNTSGYKGVYLCRCTGRWRAEIRHNRRRVHLGRFDDAVAAAKEYDRAALDYHGKFARLNFPASSPVVDCAA